MNTRRRGDRDWGRDELTGGAGSTLQGRGNSIGEHGRCSSPASREPGTGARRRWPAGGGRRADVAGSLRACVRATGCGAMQTTISVPVSVQMSTKWIRIGPHIRISQK
jgi:hypothetical protein